MSRPWEPRAMVRQRKPDSSTSSESSPPGKGGVVISCGPPCQGLTPHLLSTQTRSNPHPATGERGNGKNLLYLSGNLHWLLTTPVSFTVLQKHEAKPQNREAQVNSRDTRSPPTRLGSVHSIIWHLEALRLLFFQNNLGPSVYLSRNSSWIFAVCCSYVWKASIIKSRRGKTKADLSAGRSHTAKRKQRKQTICEHTGGWMFLAVNDQWISLNTNLIHSSQDQFVNDLLS